MSSNGGNRKLNVSVQKKNFRAFKSNPCLSQRALANKVNYSRSKCVRIKEKYILNPFKKF